MKEVWRDIPGYEGYYQASNLGNIKSLPKKYKPLGRILKPQQRNNYLIVSLSRDGKSKSQSVHRIIMKTFKGESNLTVNHIDGNKHNNKLENLEWVSRKQNMQHGTCIKRMKETKRKRQGHPIYIIDKDGSDYFFGSIAEACEEFGLDSGNVKLCLRGNRKRHHGYTFESCK